MTTELGGRPEKISPPIRMKIMTAIARNAPYKFAAWNARICEKTLYAWLERGKLHKEQGLDSEYSRFSQDVNEAEALKVMQHLDTLETGEKNWQSRLALLERRWREEFGQDGGELVELKKQMDELKKMFQSLMEPAQVNKSE